MAISRKCLACNTYRDDCTGKCMPCGKWEAINFDCDMKPTANEAGRNVTETAVPPRIETTVVPPSQLQKPTAGIVLDGESRLQKFDRIAAKRQAQALEAIRKIGHLTSKYHRQRTGVTAYTYEWTREMALAVLIPVEEALEELKGELLGCDSPREHGLIDED